MLLTHPFYQRWEAGGLSREELGSYAGQYRHIEAVLPEVLRNVLRGLPEGRAKATVAANLSDELRPVPHLSLFEDFGQSVGAPTAVTASPATAALIGCYQAAVAAGPAHGLAALAAYEVQAAAIAVSKAEGLRRHYGVDARGTRFWDVHAELEGSHAEWTSDALAELARADTDVTIPAKATADAWWDFLSEQDEASQEEAATVPAAASTG